MHHIDKTMRFRLVPLSCAFILFLYTLTLALYCTQVTADIMDNPSNSNNNSNNRHNHTYNETNNNNYEETLLDVFAHTAADILTHHVIPQSDAVCDWSWRTLRCEPMECGCAWQFELGDYHLGRACRLLVTYNQGDDTELNRDVDECVSTYLFRNKGKHRIRSIAHRIKDWYGEELRAKVTQLWMQIYNHNNRLCQKQQGNDEHKHLLKRIICRNSDTSILKHKQNDEDIYNKSVWNRVTSIQKNESVENQNTFLLDRLTSFLIDDEESDNV